jgi:hypothetical protein
MFLLFVSPIMATNLSVMVATESDGSNKKPLTSSFILAQFARLKFGLIAVVFLKMASFTTNSHF